MPGHFELLGIRPIFDIDNSALEQAYFQQQRLFHPDRFAGKPTGERQIALQRSVDINNAYNILKNPLTRACYLLKSQGIVVGTENDTIKPSHALLMEVMEWREDAETATTTENVNALDTKLHHIEIDCIKVLSDAFSKNAYHIMAQETLKLSYVLKSREELARYKNRIKKPA